jgi:hypothetical protein
MIVEDPPKDIEEYLKQTYKNYQVIKEEKIWNLVVAIRHYTNTLSSESYIDLKALNLVALIEYVVGRFSEQEKTSRVFEEASFTEAKKQELRRDFVNSLLKQFSNEDLVVNDYISSVKKHSKKGTIKVVVDQIASSIVEGLNGRGFPWSLDRLLNNLKLATSTGEIEVFVKMRNKLVHEARFLNEGEFKEMGIPFESETLQFLRIVSLTSRIMLAILGYEGYFYNGQDHAREGVEWSGAEKLRMKMQYTTGMS